MSIIRTKIQAQGLQRCSTHGCILCDRQGRTYSDHAAAIEHWNLIESDDRPNFGWQAHGLDGPAMLRSPHVITMRYARVCSKHKSATGVAVHWNLPNQMKRRIVGLTI